MGVQDVLRELKIECVKENYGEICLSNFNGLLAASVYRSTTQKLM